MSVRSLNKVLLIGNMTRDPELRYTPSGTAVCNFGLATNRQWVSAEGTTQEATEFHRIVAWAKLAEICSQLLFKGRKVYIEGRLQTREWTAADGSKQRTTEVVADTMIILDSKRREEGRVVTEGVPAVAEAALPGEETPVVPETPEKVAEGAGALEETKAAPALGGKKSSAGDKKGKKKKEEKATKEAKGGDEEEVKPEDLPF